MTFNWDQETLPVTRFAVALTVCSVLTVMPWPVPAYGQGTSIAPTTLHLIWSALVTVRSAPPPVVGKPHAPPQWSGTVLGPSADRQGRNTFLARRSENGSVADLLLPDLASRGFQQMVPIRLTGAQAAEPLGFLAGLFQPGRTASSEVPSIEALAIDSEGAAWVGGAIGFYYGMASEPHGRAYVARLGADGKATWERSYAAGRAPSVVSMTSASSGGVLVAANDVFSLDSSWLAMIAAKDGTVVWEQHVGNGTGIVVAPSTDGAFLIATIESEGMGEDYRENIAVRRVAADGRLGPASVIRPEMNRRRGMNFGALRMSPAAGGGYVVSGWEVPFEQDPALLKLSEIAKVDPEGHLVWKKAIPMSFIVNEGRGGATFCEKPAVTSLPDGDALVACALKGRLRIHRFNGLTGEDSQGDLPLPPCEHGDRPTVVSLFVGPSGQILVSGSPLEANGVSGCSWLARLTP